MDIKLELAQNSMEVIIRNVLENVALQVSEIADTAAIKALSEIKQVIGDEGKSDFEVIEEIVCILEKNNVDCRGRHDF